MSYTDEFDVLMAQLPVDWTFFDCFVTVEDPARLTNARIALARANARPVRGPANHDFEITVAHTWGHGAQAGVVRSALRILDDLGIRGRAWAGDVSDMLRPAAAHRYGP